MLKACDACADMGQL